MDINRNSENVSKTLYIAKMGLLLALTVVLSALENMIPIPLPLGVKPGFSNIIIMFALMNIDTKSALTLNLLKSAFVFLTRGVTAFFLSLSGGLISFAVMALLYKKTNSSLILLSVSGGISHNLAQLLAAAILLKSTSAFYYSPVLVLSGIAAGTATGIILKAVMPALMKIKISK
jgi:heptaprenyl diphosphate synthase